MSIPSIPGFPQIPIPNIGQLLPLPTGSSSPFSNQQQTDLQAFANGLTNFNTGLLTSAATDFINAEQQLNSNNLNFVSLAQQLQNLLVNPQQYISQTLGAAFLSNASTGFPVQIYTALGSPNNVPVVTVKSNISNPTLVSNAGSGVGVVNASNSVGISTTSGGSNSSGQGTEQISVILPSQLRPFFNALAGQNPLQNSSGDFGSNDFFTGLQGLYNFWLNNIYQTNGIFADISTFTTAFNTAGLLNNSVNPSNVTYTFPLSSGSTFLQFVQSLLTFTLEPATVIAELVLSPPQGATGAPTSAAQLSLSQAIYSFLGKQSKGSSQIIAGQQYLEPIVNVLFGTNPTISATSDPFQTLFNLVSSPTNFVSGLFSKNTVSGTSPQSFIKDLISNPGNVPTDILNFVSSPFPSFFTNLFPSQNITGFGTVSLSSFFTDAFNPSTIVNLPCDLLSLVPMTTYLGNNSLNPVSLCNMLSSFFNNLIAIPTSAFTGKGKQPSSTTWLVDTISYSNTTNGWNSTAPGWSSSGGTNSFNGVLQGDLGYAYMAAATAANEIALVIKDGVSASNVGLSVGADFQRVVAAPIWVAEAVGICIMYINQLLGAVMNIQNILKNSNLPTSPTGSIPGASNLQNLIVTPQ
jgi:hypothetical protein